MSDLRIPDSIFSSSFFLDFWLAARRLLREEGPFLLASEQLEIVVIKSEGVMALEFLAIFQCDGLCVRVTVFPPLA